MILPNIVLAMSSLFFVDDITMHSAHQSLAFAASRIQHTIQRISEQANYFNLTYFTTKLSTIIFALKSYNSVNAVLAYGNLLTPIVSASNYLVITLHS